MTGNFVYSLAADAKGHLYAGTADSGIFRSFDKGKSWTKLSLPRYTIEYIAVADTANVVVGLGIEVGISHSSDAGNSWGSVLLAYSWPRSLYVDPLGNIFTGVIDLHDSLGGKVFESTNLGLTWQRRDSTLANALMISFLRLSPTVILAGGISTALFIDAPPPNEWFFFGGLFQSTDNGATWDRTALDHLSIPALVMTPQGHILAGTYYYGIYRSVDTGRSWQTSYAGFADSMPSIKSLVCTSKGDLFAGTVREVYTSKDDGLTWKKVSEGIFSLTVYSLALDSAGYLFAGTSDGVFRSQYSTTDVSPHSEPVVSHYKLFDCYPNPFNLSTVIEYELPTLSSVDVTIYDLLGRRINTLFKGINQPGHHELTWSGGDQSGLIVSNGVYVCRLLASGYADTKIPTAHVKKVVLMK